MINKHIIWPVITKKSCLDDDFYKPAINSDNESSTFIDSNPFLKRDDENGNETFNENKTKKFQMKSKNNLVFINSLQNK